MNITEKQLQRINNVINTLSITLNHSMIDYEGLQSAVDGCCNTLSKIIEEINNDFYKYR